MMGCYGIGVSRLLSTIVEQHGNEEESIGRKRLHPMISILFKPQWKTRIKLLCASRASDACCRL